MSTLENTSYLSPVRFERAKADLSTTRFSDLRWVDSTGSTNADVRDLLPTAAGASVLVADHQSAGRGRLDRSWEAPPGTSLLLSIGLPVDAIEPRRRSLLTFALALAATDAVRELRLKWPNDLIVPVDGDDVLGYRKVGGILAEAHRVTGSAVSADWVVLGIGLNVNWPSIPDELAANATSLNLVRGEELDREQLLVSLLESFDERWLPAVESGDDSLLVEYRRRCATIGAEVRVDLGRGEVLGIATDVDDDGALVVEGAEGPQIVTVGDVVHVRPAG